MIIFLTGHTGFVGTRLKKHLENLGHEVFGVGSELDLSDIDKVSGYIGNICPETIIHCGAISDIRKCEENPEEAYKANYLGSKNIADIAQDKGLNLVYFSSDQVYNMFELERKTEETKPDPQNYYGKLKLLAEQEITKNLTNYHILRIAWQFSLFDNVPTAGRGGFTEVIYNAYTQQKEFKASENSFRNICNVYDTVDVVCKMVEKRIPFGLYNVSAKSEFSVYEMAKFTASALKCESLDFIVPYKDEKPYNLCADPVALSKAGYQMPSFTEDFKSAFNK